MTLEATITGSSLAFSSPPWAPIPPTNNPCSQVVSVAREDAAEPYITNFWLGNTSAAVVTCNTLAAYTGSSHCWCTPYAGGRDRFQQTLVHVDAYFNAIWANRSA